MKYIVMQVKSEAGAVLELPIIFPKELVHLEVANSLRRSIRHSMAGIISAEPISAGFINSMDFEGRAYGDSESLKVKSRPSADTLLIQGADYGSTIVS